MATRSSSPRQGTKRKQPGSGFKFPATVSRPELLDEGDDRRFRQFLYDLSVLTSHIDTVRAHLATRMDLTPPQYNIIMVVAQYQDSEPVTVSTVADHLHVSNAFVAVETNKLVGRGLLTKEPNPRDGRGVLLRTTEAAESAIMDIATQLRAVNDGVFRSLSRDEFQRFSELTAQMIEDAISTIDEISFAHRSLQRAQGTPARSTGAPQARRRLRRPVSAA